MELNMLAKEINDIAKSKGFWAEPREIGTLLMLCVSELSEALEADRKCMFANMEGYERLLQKHNMSFNTNAFEATIKDTFEDELADTIIRILDICGARDIDIKKHIELKMKYNETRNRLHNKKY